MFLVAVWLHWGRGWGGFSWGRAGKAGYRGLRNSWEVGEWREYGWAALPRTCILKRWGKGQAGPQRLGFPESGFGFSGFGQTRGCYRNGPNLYLADASYPSEGLPQSILSQIPPLCQLNKDDMNALIVSLFSSKIQGPRRQASFLSVPFCFPFTKSCQALCWH